MQSREYPCPLFRNDSSSPRNLRVFRNDYDPIPDKPDLPIHIRLAREGPDDHSFAQTGIFIQDRSFNIAIGTDPDRNRRRVFVFIVIRPHQDAILDPASRGDLGADPDYRVGDIRILDPAAITQEDTIDLAMLNHTARQIAGMCIDRRLRVIKAERRDRRGHFQVDLIEGTDGTDVPPVSVKIKPINAMGMNRFGNDIDPKIVMTWMLLEQFDQDMGFKKVNPHGPLERALRIDPADEPILGFAVLWLLHKVGYTAADFAF